MAVRDFVMPHRLLVNKKLRKEAEALKIRVNLYQGEYERLIEECQTNIQQAEKDSQEKLTQLKNDLISELQVEQCFLQVVAQDLAAYADTYLNRDCLLQVRDIKRKQIEIMQADVEFLNKQMYLIGEEINLLRARQNELTAYTDISDIMQLTSLSDYHLDLAREDANELLNKVSQAIQLCDEQNEYEKYALIRLRGILQERSEYDSTIKYIGWVINQKINYSKQLSNRRNCINNSLNSVKQELRDLDKQISSAYRKMEELAKKIRFFWAEPITYLNADISYAYKEKEEASKQLSEVGAELKSMADWHSDDQDKWERLQGERRDLLSEIESIKDTILAKKKKRTKWYDKRDYLFQICKSHGISMISDKKTETDETCIIVSRLQELEEIRVNGLMEAEVVCEAQRTDIISSYTNANELLVLELASIEKDLTQLEKQCKEIEAKIKIAKADLERIKETDDRFIIVKMFSDAPGLDIAKKTLYSLRTELSDKQKLKTEIEKKKIDVQERISALSKQHELNLRRCKPKPSRPTSAEAVEEKKLKYRMEEIERRRGENNGKNKN